MQRSTSDPRAETTHRAPLAPTRMSCYFPPRRTTHHSTTDNKQMIRTRLLMIPAALCLLIGELRAQEDYNANDVDPCEMRGGDPRMPQPCVSMSEGSQYITVHNNCQYSSSFHLDRGYTQTNTYDEAERVGSSYIYSGESMRVPWDPDRYREHEPTLYCCYGGSSQCGNADIAEVPQEDPPNQPNEEEILEAKRVEQCNRDWNTSPASESCKIHGMSIWNNEQCDLDRPSCYFERDGRGWYQTSQQNLWPFDEVSTLHNCDGSLTAGACSQTPPQQGGEE